MTDKEIIKALECCGDEEELHWCTECPYYDKENDFCQEDLHRDAIALINRQQAEIEKLNVELVGMRGACNSYKMHYDNTKAELERLIVESQMADGYANALEERAKSEAIKELMENAEKELYIKQDEHRKHWEEYLKIHKGTKAYQDHERAVDNWLRGYGEAVQDILSVNDNLVKEMVGEDNAQ